MPQKKSATVITFGTFDLFHVGHLRLLQRAKALGGRLVVGVSTDALNVAKKTKRPIIPQADRMELVKGVAGVDEVFLEESLELKPSYIRHHGADVLAMGDDWEGKFDGLRDVCRVVYLKRTKNVSTSYLLDYIVNG